MSTNYISQITATNGTTYDISSGMTSRIFRATCSTAAATAAKVATLDDSTGYSLAAGVCVAVTFTDGNTAATPTLNVNSGGAKTIVYPSAINAISSVTPGNRNSVWGKYETILFTYNGTYWIMGKSSLAASHIWNGEGDDSIIEGDSSNTANGDCSHAEGSGTQASKDYSHAEGYQSVAYGVSSHAEGSDTSAVGDCSHAGGEGTEAKTKAQTAIGTYNINDAVPSTAVHPNGDTAYGNYAFIIGNGTSSARHNALTVDWKGKLTIEGHSSPIGSVLSTSGSTSKTLSAGNTVNLLSLSLPIGVWAVSGSASISSASGNKSYSICIGQTATAMNARLADNNMRSDYFRSTTGSVILGVSGFFINDGTANETCYLNVESSVATNSTSYHLRAIRIA